MCCDKAFLIAFSLSAVKVFLKHLVTVLFQKSYRPALQNFTYLFPEHLLDTFYTHAEKRECNVRKSSINN